MSQSSFQRRYYWLRLCGTQAEIEALGATMSRDAAYTPAAAWFQRWDEMAERRGLQLEREMGLATGSQARPEFLNEAMRQLIRELDRGHELDRVPVTPPAPAAAAAPSATPLPAAAV